MDAAPGLLRIAPGVTVATAALTWSASRSGGPGGQHVNTTASRAELRLPISAIAGLSPNAHHRLAAALGDRLTGDGDIVLHGDETRSLRRNRDLVWERLCELVVEILPEPKRRRVTRPTWGSVQRRLGEKSRRADIKRDRRVGDD